MVTKMVKLDLKDKRLLYQLSRNCRISDTQLAKKVQVSKNTIKYRIKRLEKLGIIRKFSTVTNIGRINLDTFTLLIKFNEDIYEKKEIMEYFKKHPHVNWAATLSGQWDIFAEIIYKDNFHLQKIVNEIINRFGTQINMYQTFLSQDTLRVEHLIRDFYKEINPEPVVQKERKGKIIHLEQNDKKILYELNQDSRQNILSISKKIGLSVDTIKSRIKKLVNNGIIIKFFAEVNLKDLGYTQYLYTIKVKNFGPKVEELKRTLANNENVTYAFRDTNGYNIVAVITFRDTDEIDHLFRSIRKKFSDIIHNQEYLLIKEHIKFDLFPKGLLEGFPERTHET